jgi:hypothetical protein
MPENPDQKSCRLPRNTEHFEALQLEVNKEREKIIKKLPKKIQKNFQIMDECTKALDKANLPFLFLVNPFGYNFAEHPKGYWRYHKLHGKGQPYSPESEKDMIAASSHLLPHMLSFATVIAPRIKVQVVDKDGEVIFEFQKGERTK